MKADSVPIPHISAQRYPPNLTLGEVNLKLLSCSCAGVPCEQILPRLQKMIIAQWVKQAPRVACVLLARRSLEKQHCFGWGLTLNSLAQVKCLLFTDHLFWTHRSASTCTSAVMAIEGVFKCPLGSSLQGNVPC